MNRFSSLLSSAEIDAAASDWVIRRESGLSEREKIDFAAWQAADPRHAEALVRHDRTWSLLDRPLTAGKGREMVGALSARASRRRRNRMRAAAAVAVIFCLGLVWQLPRSTPLPDARENAVVVLPPTRTLPDGSVIELKNGAEVTVDYSGQFRRVTLVKGEAVFSVAKNKDRPFIVAAAGIEVRAVGTAFMVEVGGVQVDVIVTEGRVAVGSSSSSPALPHSSASVESAATKNAPTLVDAGKRVRVDLKPDSVSPQPVEISSSEISERLAWRAARLEFSYTPLAKAIALMNQHSRIKLVIDDPALADLPVNGLFRADNTETLIRLLESNFEVKAVRSGETITLSKAR